MKTNLQLLAFLLLSVISIPLAVLFLLVRMAWAFSGEFLQNINALIRSRR